MDRNLTDEDIKVIVDMLEKRALERLQTNVGKGVLSFIWTWLARFVILWVAYKMGAAGAFNRVGF